MEYGQTNILYGENMQKYDPYNENNKKSMNLLIASARMVRKKKD